MLPKYLPVLLLLVPLPDVLHPFEPDPNDPDPDDPDPEAAEPVPEWESSCSSRSSMSLEVDMAFIDFRTVIELAIFDVAVIAGILHHSPAPLHSSTHWRWSLLHSVCSVALQFL